MEKEKTKTNTPLSVEIYLVYDLKIINNKKLILPISSSEISWKAGNVSHFFKKNCDSEQFMRMNGLRNPISGKKGLNQQGVYDAAPSG